MVKCSFYCGWCWWDELYLHCLGIPDVEINLRGEKITVFAPRTPTHARAREGGGRVFGSRAPRVISIPPRFGSSLGLWGQGGKGCSQSECALCDVIVPAEALPVALPAAARPVNRLSAAACLCEDEAREETEKNKP